jgi:hypothetical protein
LFRGLQDEKIGGQAWWCSAIIPAFGRLRQENHEFKGSLNYIVRPCPQNQGLGM